MGQSLNRGMRGFVDEGDTEAQAASVLVGRSPSFSRARGRPRWNDFGVGVAKVPEDGIDHLLRAQVRVVDAVSVAGVKSQQPDLNETTTARPRFQVTLCSEACPEPRFCSEM